MLGAKVISSSRGSEGVTEAKQSDATASVSYRIIVSVQDGLHRGAAFVSGSSKSVFLGCSPDNDLVLMDEGVPECAACLFVRDRRLTANVISAGVIFAGDELPLGVRSFEEPVLLLKIGDANLRIELLRRRSRRRSGGGVGGGEAGRVGAGRVRATRPNRALLALLGLSMTVVLAAGAGAMNSSLRDPQASKRTLADVVGQLNGNGAQISIRAGANGHPALHGHVADASMRKKLERDLYLAGIQAELQLHDVQQMGESLSRLARLTEHPCEARHLGGGRFECDAGKANQQAVDGLRALADQVPGVVGLEVHAVQEAPVPQPDPVQLVATVTEDPPKVEKPPKPTYPDLPVIRHIAMGQREQFAVDSNGQKLRPGDVVKGATVIQIRFEAVELELAGKRYTVAATPMLRGSSN